MRISSHKIRIIVIVSLAVAFVISTLMINCIAGQDPAAGVEPKIIDPGPPGGPPSDAIVLFDGKDLSKWKGAKGEAKWAVKDGYMEVNKTGNISTKDVFGNVQLHVEWATPTEIKGEGQGRGNSGVFLMEKYEIQVLDSYNNKTYYNGQAGAVYRQHTPLVNATRKPGEWQTYDIIFQVPLFDESGKVTRPARFTVFHNGVLIQNDVEVKGTTTHIGNPVYTKHPPTGSIQLQDHGNPVRYRNIWIRPL